MPINPVGSTRRSGSANLSNENDIPDELKLVANNNIDHLYDIVAKGQVGISTEAQSSLLASEVPAVRTIKKKNDVVADDNTNKLKLSENQVKALRKYPSLVDALGSPIGEKLVKDLIIKLNSMVYQDVVENTKSMSKLAYSSSLSGQNIKQYFMPDDKSWVCSIIASGPFTKEDAIFYDKDNDAPLILRKSGETIVDVTRQFNVIHEIDYVDGKETLKENEE